ncbi:MAG: hypothetical protein HY259_00560 [Chloroflexi bacterium]|nr:hypothetical protein [Chloroflexota bacterium]MBI3731942.1 hypothetical protein [Chloroflexota bacterium]
MTTKIIASMVGVVLTAASILGGGVVWTQAAQHNSAAAPVVDTQDQQAQTDDPFALLDDQSDSSPASPSSNAAPSNAASSNAAAPQTRKPSPLPPTQDNRKDVIREAEQLGLRTAVEAAAKALNMTQKQLLSDLRAGQSLDQVAAAQKVPVQSVKDAVIAAERTAFDQAVKNGKLTRDQAERFKSALVSRIDKLFAGRAPSAGG